MKRIYIYFFIVGLFCVHADGLISQSPWTKTYPIGFTTGGIINIEHHPDGGFVALAGANTASQGELIVLMRLNEMGDTLFTKTYKKHALANRWPVKMAQSSDNSGYFILTTSVIDKGFGITAHYNSVLKVNNELDSLWLIDLTSQADYASANLKDIAATPDGGCVVTGGGPFFNTEPPVYKVNQAGNLSWTFAGGPTGIYSRFHKVTVADNGTIFAVGRHEIGNTTSYRLMVSKLNSNGSAIWNKTFHSGIVGQGDMIRSEGFDVMPLSDGGCLVTGFQTNPGSNFGPAFLMRLDQEGERDWEETYYDDTDFVTRGERILAAEGGSYLFQLKRYARLTSSERHIIKFTAAGNTEWDQWGYDYFETNLHMDKVDQDGGILLVGNTMVDNDDPAGFIIKTTHDGMYRSPEPYVPGNGETVVSEPVRFEWDPNGAIQNVTSYHFQIASDDSFGNILFENSNLTNNFIGIDGFSSFTDYYWRVRAKGAEGGAGFWSNGWLMSTGMITSIDQLPEGERIYLDPVQPNPALYTATLNYGLKWGEKVEIVLYDLTGKRKETLFTGEQASGDHTLVFDVSALDGGMYIIVLRSSAGMLSRTFVVGGRK